MFSFFLGFRLSAVTSYLCTIESRYKIAPTHDFRQQEIGLGFNNLLYLAGKAVDQEDDSIESDQEICSPPTSDKHPFRGVRKR